MESGQALMRIDRSRLSYAQDVEHASAHVLERAERDLSLKLEAYQEADHVERCARRDALVREIVEQLTATLAKGDVLRALYAEDPKHQTFVDFPQLSDFIRAWLVVAETHLNPPKPKPLDPSMTLVRFIKSFPGRAASDFRRSITAWGVGETAAFGKAEVDFLFELGVVEPFSIPPAEQQPSEASSALRTP
jgi:hypothetical protein